MKEATVTRVVAAPRDQVWKAFTQPERFAGWFGTPPFTTRPETVALDVRPGGAWRATMVHESDGSELPFRGTYRDVTEPERLVFTYEDVADPGNPDVEVATVTLTEVGDGTEIVYHQAGNMPDEQYPQVEQGVAGFFGRLAAQLERP